MSPENVIFIFICIVVVAFVVALLIILKQSRKKVESHSERIKQIKKINEEIKFHNLKDSFTITKHYDNKSNFIKVEPQYIMTACLQNNMAYFIDYVRKTETAIAALEAANGAEENKPP